MRHLPVDALVFSPQAKYLYIGRDGRDALWSFHNHHSGANDLWYEAINNTLEVVGPPIERVSGTIHDHYRRWTAGIAIHCTAFWEISARGRYATCPTSS